MQTKIHSKSVRASCSTLTLTAVLNLMQKSLNIWKHSSNFIVSLSSQKKSMRAFPSFCNSRFWCSSSFRCLTANCSKNHTHMNQTENIYIYTMGHVYIRNLWNSCCNLEVVTEPRKLTSRRRTRTNKREHAISANWVKKARKNGSIKMYILVTRMETRKKLKSPQTNLQL